MDFHSRITITSSVISTDLLEAKADSKKLHRKIFTGSGGMQNQNVFGDGKWG
jgi:hypothetical protein